MLRALRLAAVCLAAPWLATPCLLVGASTAHAAGPSPKGPLDPLTQAEELISLAQQEPDAGERHAMADRAVAICEQYGKEHPRDPEPILRLVHALTIADPAQPELCRAGRCERALVELDRIGKIDPFGIQAAEVIAQRGIILSRMQRFEEALRAYEAGLPLIQSSRRPNNLDERTAAALLWGNSAETAMGLGRLDDAIRRYELALDHSSYGEAEWLLSLYGLGVALDRDGQIERAQKTMQRALERDPALSRLRDESVFFEPPGDIHYYEGLAHEVAGDDALARAAFARYLVAQPTSRYAARARTHLAELDHRVGAARPPAEISIVFGRPMRVEAQRPEAVLLARLRTHAGELSTCYQRALRDQPGLRVSMQLALEISTLGFVGPRGVHVLSSTEPSLELSRCVELSAESWRFPPLHGEAVEAMLVPIDFSPGDEAPAQTPPRRRR